MPGKVKVKIVAGRNLPVMDRSSDTTDAYVEIKLGNTTFKTDVCRKSLNPQWNSEWYRFEMDDAELQDEPLQIRLMDHDTYSANDAIGKVYLDLKPLLLPPIAVPAKTFPDTGGPASSVSLSGGSTMSGWFPVYDTMHGIRGEVNIIVKVELFSDFNKFRQSSCGVQFFNSSSVPQGHFAQNILGLVEELVVDDDPEYQWIDKIRTPRASNEARQTLFFKLSGEVQRKIGLKVLDLGGNAVIGYLQCFDLEGESGIVVRGIGTAVNLIKFQDHAQPPAISCDDRSDSGLVEPWQSSAPPSRVVAEDVQPSTSKSSQSPAKLNSVQGIHRRSSDSDLSITPKGNSLTSSDRSSLAGGGVRVFHSIFHRSIMYKETLEILEYPFLTMTKYPPGFILYIGGLVTARSVKLLERITNLEEPESRDSWWTELRMEVRSHARALGCNVVLGYSEHSAICDDICVLSASGTAAIINVRGDGGVLNLSSNVPALSDTPEPPISIATKLLGSMTTSLDRSDFERQGSLPQTAPLKPDSDGGKARHTSESGEPPPESPLPPCSIYHMPYNVTNVPLNVNITKCAICRKGKVPDVMLTTIEPPDSIPVAGRCCLLQAFVCRPKRDCRGELNAKDISDGLPFLEYDLHSQLINKLKVNGMNAIFRLRTQVCLGERMIAALATGTAVLLPTLPIPLVPTVAPGNAWKDEAKFSEIQKKLHDTIKKNREYYQLKTTLNVSQEGETSARGRTSDTEDSDDDLPDIDLTAGTKDTCILEVDDAEDADVISQLIDPHPPEGFHVTASEQIPGLEDLEVVRNLQMFTQVWRSRMPANVQMSSLNKNFHRLLQEVYFKLRRMTPCVIGNVQFRVELPEPDELQISLVGMALGLGEVDKTRHLRRKFTAPPVSKDISKRPDEGDMIFCLEEDQESTGSTQATNKPTRPRSPTSRPFRRSIHVAPKEHYGVDMTTLSYIPGSKIERYHGNLNFFFIRESSCIREGGGLSGFVHSFVAEALAIVRAHVTALGGNAMVAYFMNECILLNNPHKNHGQCLINIGGDAVSVSYSSGE